MIEVEVRVDDDIYIFRRGPGSMQVIHQLFPWLIKTLHLVRKLVADAGLDQDVLFSCPDKDGVQSGEDAVSGVRFHLSLPQDLGHYPEEGPAIRDVKAVRKNSQLKIAQ